MSTKTHFNEELKILENNLEKGDNLVIKDYIPTIKEIIKIFSKQGHSGMSAPYYASILSDTIKKTLMQEPLSPINGSDNEWNNTGFGGDTTFQNNRCSAIFKKNKNTQPYYLNAIVWNGEKDYDSFTGIVEGISSSQYIKLPFIPKIFYIDVIKTFPDKKDLENYDYKIKDVDQFREVSQYYDLNHESNFPKELLRKFKLEKLN